MRQKTEWSRGRAMTETADRALQRRIRVLPEQWERIENAARGTSRTANELVIDLALEALDRQEWPRTEAEIKVARASLFAAQVLARELVATGKEHEIEEIREFISTMVPDYEEAETETLRSDPQPGNTQADKSSN